MAMEEEGAIEAHCESQPPNPAAASTSSATPAATWHPGQPYTVILFYRYADLTSSSVAALVESVRSSCSALGLAGRVLLAEEGVNGTLAGAEPAVQAFIQLFTSLHPAFRSIDWKRSQGAAQQLPFPDLCVRQVREIISTGAARQVLAQCVGFDPATFGGLAAESTGRHLSPQEFHDMLGAGAAGSVLDPSTQQCNASCSGGRDASSPSPAGAPEAPLVIDVRNNYEYDVGHFEGAVGLDVATYAESWGLLDRIIEEHQLLSSSRPVLMYCTGGIRCEKASAYVRAAGLACDRVFQLQGGIHRYLEEFPDGGHFQGRNVVFDARCTMAAVDGAAAPGGGTDAAAGEEAEGSDQVALRCVFCSGPGEVLGRCTVCNAVLRVCGGCHSQHCGLGEFHCRRHTHLSAVYFRRLERFDRAQLEQQAAALAALLGQAEVLEKKNRRRMLRNQMRRIEQQLEMCTP